MKALSSFSSSLKNKSHVWFFFLWSSRYYVSKSWEKFLKAHSQPFFQFLLVLPRRYPHAAGVAEKEDDVMLTQKSVDVLLSLASSMLFSYLSAVYTYFPSVLM
jgi:hypothetical protein